MARGGAVDSARADPRGRAGRAAGRRARIGRAARFRKAGCRPGGPRVAAEDRPRALRRRRARPHAHRRAQGAARDADPGRLHRGDVDGRDRRRPVRERHVAGRDAAAIGRGELAHAAVGQPAAARRRVSPQGGGVAVSAGHRAGLQRRRVPLVQGRAVGQQSRALPARADAQGRERRGLRQAADSVPRGRDEHGDRQGSGLRPRPPLPGDARQHVGAGNVRAGRARRAHPGGRRAGQQPAGRRRAPDGRRHRDRREHRHAAHVARPAPVGRRLCVADDQHPDRAERARAAGAARARRHPDLAGPGQPVVHRLRGRAEVRRTGDRRRRRPRGRGSRRSPTPRRSTRSSSSASRFRRRRPPRSSTS